MIRLSKSTVGDRETQALAEVIRDGRLGMGSFVQKFEGELAEFIGGGREVVCVNSGTAALQVAIEACGIGAGDEVLVPTITFVASFQAVSATGAVPVACDVEPETCTLDVADAERRITARTRAIMPVHYASGQGNLDGVYRLAERHALRVVEDAAHAFGCAWNGGLVGSSGDVVCFSFDGIKNITCGEGGAVVSANGETIARARDARLLGVEKDTEKRYRGERSWEFDVRHQGWRYHMSNLNAAIGSVQLRRLEDEFGPARVRLAKRYAGLLACIPGLALLPLEYGPVIPHIFPVRIAGNSVTGTEFPQQREIRACHRIAPAARGKRDAVRAALVAGGVECGIHYKPNHLLSLYGGGRVHLPVAERLYEELLTLPLHVELTDEEQDRVVRIVLEELRP